MTTFPGPFTSNHLVTSTEWNQAKTAVDEAQTNISNLQASYAAVTPESIETLASFFNSQQLFCEVSLGGGAYTGCQLVSMTTGTTGKAKDEVVIPVITGINTTNGYIFPSVLQQGCPFDTSPIWATVPSGVAFNNTASSGVCNGGNVFPQYDLNNKVAVVFNTATAGNTASVGTGTGGSTALATAIGTSGARDVLVGYRHGLGHVMLHFNGTQWLVKKAVSDASGTAPTLTTLGSGTANYSQFLSPTHTTYQGMPPVNWGSSTAAGGHHFTSYTSQYGTTVGDAAPLTTDAFYFFAIQNTNKTIWQWSISAAGAVTVNTYALSFQPTMFHALCVSGRDTWYLVATDGTSKIAVCTDVRNFTNAAYWTEYTLSSFVRSGIAISLCAFRYNGIPVLGILTPLSTTYGTGVLAGYKWNLYDLRTMTCLAYDVPQPLLTNSNSICCTPSAQYQDRFAVIFLRSTGSATPLLGATTLKASFCFHSGTRGTLRHDGVSPE